jgi:hypothetical protein
MALAGLLLAVLFAVPLQDDKTADPQKPTESPSSSVTTSDEQGEAAPPARPDGFDRPRETTGRPEVSGPNDAAESEANGRGVAKAWLTRLKESKSARITLRAHRRTEPSSGKSVGVRAVAVMRPQALRLDVWDVDEYGQEARSEPTLILEYRDGMIDERLRLPESGEYRTRKYPAPLKSGANDTDYVEGCQVGTLLQSWLGDSDQAETFEENIASSVILPRRQDVGGTSCLIFRLCRNPKPDASGQVRADYFYFDDAGILRRWETVVKVQAKSRELIQTRDYEFEFSDGASTVNTGEAATPLQSSPR